MSRPLTTDERIEARHLLQVLAERTRAVRNAMEPETGVLAITDEAWFAEWKRATQGLDAFTERVRQGQPAHPYSTGDHSA